MAAPPAKASLPRHVAIIMDGNGRWAEARGLERHLGHREGVAPVKRCVEECLGRGIGALTLFAFSSENWHRPEAEVTNLMSLFVEAIDGQVDELHGQGVRLRFIGDRATLSATVRSRMAAAESRTAGNGRLALNVAVSYGGRWDIVQAARSIAMQVSKGELAAEAIDEESFARAVELRGLPDPDLFIRTGGERRISNFLLWNLAYTELWFTDVLWPDFDSAAFEAALNQYAGRERRYGRTHA